MEMLTNVTSLLNSRILFISEAGNLIRMSRSHPFKRHDICNMQVRISRIPFIDYIPQNTIKTDHIISYETHPLKGEKPTDFP